MVADKEAKRPSMSLRDFLEKVHPGVEVDLEDLVEQWDRVRDLGRVRQVAVRLYCGSDDCKREQNFGWSSTQEVYVAVGRPSDRFLYFWCRNCGRTEKVYSIRFFATSTDKAVRARKLGENPGFGARTMSPRFDAFLGQSREMFFRGRRCEGLGMGIGAFAYFRRVVDAQKNKLLDAILDVCAALNAPEEIVREIQAAKRETRFSKAVEAIKSALPDALQIDGHSPLTLLYAALSKGLHEMSDEECLEKAQAIRLVLTELLDRVGRLVTEDKELKAAVGRLLPGPKSQAAAPAPSPSGSPKNQPD
jgi:hypothetical protein